MLNQATKVSWQFLLFLHTMPADSTWKDKTVGIARAVWNSADASATVVVLNACMHSLQGVHATVLHVASQIVSTHFLLPRWML